MTAVAHFGYRIARLFGVYAGIAICAAGALFVSYQGIVVTEVAYRNASSFLADSGLSLSGVADSIVLFELLAVAVIGYFLHQRGDKISAVGSSVASAAAVWTIADFILRLRSEGNDRGGGGVVVFFLLIQLPMLPLLFVMIRELVFDEPLSHTEETTKEKSDTF
jgi:hypothetical protein